MTADNVIELIFAILSAVLTCFLIPWIRARKTAEERESLAETVRIAVQAAEQMISGAGRGSEKKDYVRKWLHEQGVKMNEQDIWDEVNAMIESAVLELKKGD